MQCGVAIFCIQEYLKTGKPFDFAATIIIFTATA
jgi:hypothetical protein